MRELERRVAAFCDAVPDGRVTTYGYLAALCGYPRHARHVGQALGRGVSRQAYKVVNAAGKLSGAASFLVPGLQAELLRLSGVWVSEEGRVDLETYLWQPTEAEVDAVWERLKNE